jgi:hypothetical protein
MTAQKNIMALTPGRQEKSEKASTKQLLDEAK